MTKKEKTLYQRFGGKEILEKVMNRFFLYVLTDKQVGRYYVANINDFGMHYKNFINAIAQITGGPSFGYRETMAEKHKNMNIKKRHFDIVWEYLAISFCEEGVVDNLIDEVRKAIYGIAGDIVKKQQASKEQIKKRQRIQEKKRRYHKFIEQQKQEKLQSNTKQQSNKQFI